MTLSNFEWIMVTGVAGLAITVISFFLKRVFNRTDDHEKDISEIKRTYVTKDELKEIKTELRDENRKLTADVAEIKDNYLTKEDYFRTQMSTERKLDRIYELLIKEKEA